MHADFDSYAHLSQRAYQRIYKMEESVMIKKFGILISIMVLALLACQGVSASTTYQYYTEFGTGYLNGPSGIVPVNNQIFVSNDGTDNLAYFGNFGHSFGGYIGNTGSGDGDFISPQGLAAANSPYLYVADSGNNRIQKFQLIGNTMVFTTKWGSTGTGVGQFNNPLGVAVDAAGYVYVADSNNQRVQVFSDTGTHQRTITGNFDNPMGLAVRGNAVYVTGSNDQVQIINKDTGAAIGNFGATGTGAGQLNDPIGITFDAAGYVYVADAANNRVQKFQLIGNSAVYITTIGQGSFNYPTDVFVDALGYVYVSDYLNNKVQVWKPYTPSPSPGGGGGSTTLPPAVSVGTASLMTNTAGQVLQTVLLDSPSKKARLSVSTGTYVLGSNGNPLSQISMDDLSAANLPAVPSEGTFTFGGYAVQCSPTGATFNPSARLTFSFTEAEWNTLMAQAQNTPGQLVVKWYDNANGVWVNMPTTVNEGARTLTATITHFSVFAVFADTAEPSVVPTPTPVTPVVTPVATPVVTPEIPVAPEPVSEFPWVYVIVGIVIIILIAGGAYYYTQKK